MSCTSFDDLRFSFLICAIVPLLILDSNAVLLLKFESLLIDGTAALLLDAAAADDEQMSR